MSYEPLKNDFNTFYPELLEYTEKQLTAIKKQV